VACRAWCAFCRDDFNGALTHISQATKPALLQQRPSALPSASLSFRHARPCPWLRGRPASRMVLQQPVSKDPDVLVRNWLLALRVRCHLVLGEFEKALQTSDGTGLQYALAISNMSNERGAFDAVRSELNTWTRACQFEVIPPSNSLLEYIGTIGAVIRSRFHRTRSCCTLPGRSCSRPLSSVSVRCDALELPAA
jgi:hypothetical protein